VSIPDNFTKKVLKTIFGVLECGINVKIAYSRVKKISLNNLILVAIVF